MVYIGYLFSLFTLFTGIIIVLKPDSVYQRLGTYSRTPGIHIIAVLVRAVIGIALLFSATGSKFPVIFQVIGWASLISAVVMILIGRDRFKRLIAWAVNVSSCYKRLGGFLAILFGGFLFYGVF